MKLRVLLLALGVGSALWAVAAAPEQSCMDCHGKDGVSADSDVPTIAGQSAEYLKDQLGEYADKGRPCPETKYRAGDKSRPATDMCKLAADLGAANFDTVAKFYAGKPFVPAKQPFDAAKAATGKKVHALHCDKCHSKGGTSPEDDSGILAGQWVPYLRASFKEFSEGKREMPKKMKPKFEELKPDERDALLEYYGSVQ